MLGHCLSASEELIKPSPRWNMGTVLLFNGESTDMLSYVKLYKKLQ